MEMEFPERRRRDELVQGGTEVSWGAKDGISNGW